MAVIPADDERPYVLAVPEAARRLSLGESTVYRLIRQNRLPFVRIGRRVLVPIAKLEALVAGESE